MKAARGSSQVLHTGCTVATTPAACLCVCNFISSRRWLLAHAACTFQTQKRKSLIYDLILSFELRPPYTKDLHVPVVNTAREDLRLRSDVTHVLARLQIDPVHLAFAPELDLPALHAAGRYGYVVFFSTLFKHRRRLLFNKRRSGTGINTQVQ